jgi:uncharacterized membrane protein
MSLLLMLVKLVHVLSGAVLFGTGAGIAFFMWAADRTRDARAVAVVARIVVIADFVFTASAVVVQPISGGILMALEGWRLTEPWLLTALGLYVLTGACWLPVVAFQIEMKRLAEGAAAAGEPLPERYHTLYHRWFILGWPAFAAVIAIYALMLFKPAF